MAPLSPLQHRTYNSMENDQLHQWACDLEEEVQGTKFHSSVKLQTQLKLA